LGQKQEKKPEKTGLRIPKKQDFSGKNRPNCNKYPYNLLHKNINISELLCTNTSY
jgi:hypothetical protein